MDHSDLLENLISLLNEQGIWFCVIGGQAVNAYVEPLVSLDLDLVLAVDQMEQVEALLESHFELKRFPHSLNISMAGSDLRVQIQTDERYSVFVERTMRADGVGDGIAGGQSGRRVAREDLGRLWTLRTKGKQTTEGPGRYCPILEKYPELRLNIPQEIRLAWWN